MFRKVALVLAAPLLLVSSCAKEGDAEVLTGEAAVNALRAAPDAVADAGTARFEVVMQMTLMGESSEMTASGVSDAAAEQMQMEMDMGALFQQIAGSSGQELPPGLAGTMEFVADGSTIYMRAPMFSMMGADGWLSATPEDLGSSEDALGLGAGAYDFTQTIEGLRGIDGEPDVVGQEEVRGVDTTHYRASIDLAQALADVPADQRDELKAAFEQLGGGEDLSEVDMPVDVWIDADDLPRRMRMDMGSLLPAVGLGDGSMMVTMDFFDFGEPVDIEVPSPDEVTPASEAFAGLGGELGS